MFVLVVVFVIAVLIFNWSNKRKRNKGGHRKSATWPKEVKETRKDPGEKEQGQVKRENDFNQLEYV